MINEISHIKLGFAELAPVVATDSWLQYHFSNADSAWIVFALEERDEQPTMWRRIHSSWGYGETSMYGIYKQGAAWEVHTGQRLFHGKALRVEKYLAEVAKLPLKQLSDLSILQPMARITVDDRGMEYIDSYYGHQWDKSSWDMSEASDRGPFIIPLNSRPNLTFLQQVSGPSTVYLDGKSRSRESRPFETLDLFA